MKPENLTVSDPNFPEPNAEGWDEWGTDYKPNEIESRLKLAKHISPQNPEAYLFPKGIDEFLDAPGIYK